MGAAFLNPACPNAARCQQPSGAGKYPLLDDFDAYFRREVLPHVPEAFPDPSKTKQGYKINFTRCFDQYQPLRKRQNIRADILQPETRTEGLLNQVIS